MINTVQYYHSDSTVAANIIAFYYGHYHLLLQGRRAGPWDKLFTFRQRGNATRDTRHATRYNTKKICP